MKSCGGDRPGKESQSMATRLGVDVGGTFTDLIFYDDETGEIRVGKEPTTPSAPEEGVLAAIEAVVPGERLRAARYFLHGTTVGLNSLLTRTGAVVTSLHARDHARVYLKELAGGLSSQRLSPEEERAVALAMGDPGGEAA